MKILSNASYRDLVRKVEDINKSGDIDIEKIKVSKLSIEIEGLKRDLINKEKDHAIILTRKDFEVANKVSEATIALKKERDTLKMDLNNKTKEAEILSKAFSNLGFDVKDMKSILDKLVDGLISKNTIQLVK